MTSNKLYDYLYDYGIQKGIPLYLLAEDIGISYRTILNFKKNTAIRRLTMHKIANYLNKPIEEIYKLNQLYEI